MGELTPILGIAVLCNLLPLEVGAQPAAPKSGVQQPAEDQGPPSDPSRYAGDKVDEYVAKYAAIFSIASRTIDPFGQLQDPEAKPVAKSPSLLPSAPAQPAVPFSEIVRLIQVTTVMSAEKRFLVGSRVFGEGDRFPVNYDGRPIWVTVTEVSSRQIEFKNLETGEIASQKLNTLPPGMTPGTSGIAAPGMTPTSPQAPLDLNPGGTAPLTPPR